MLQEERPLGAIGNKPPIGPMNPGGVPGQSPLPRLEALTRAVQNMGLVQN